MRGPLTDELLTAILATRVMGWDVRPDRFLTGSRSWVSRSRFRPLVDVKDAFRLLDSVTNEYSLLSTSDGIFSASAHLAGRVGKASGKSRPHVISFAVANASGVKTEVDD